MPKPTRTSSLEQFPGDSYSNIRNRSEGLRRLRRGWETYGERRMRAFSTNGKGTE
jgi:hypothetical protein